VKDVRILIILSLPCEMQKSLFGFYNVNDEKRLRISESLKR